MRVKRTMGVRWRAIMGAAATLAILLGVHASGAQPAPGAKPATSAAKVEGEVITLEEVEQGLRAQLMKIEEQRHALLEERLDQLIGERLLAQEAKKRGTPLDQLLKTEVYGKASDVPDAEVASFITQNRARLPQIDEAELKLKVWDYLRQQKVNERRQAFIQSLRAHSKVDIYLDAPVAARVLVSADKGFVRGVQEAPVTIVEFSDFQCPFCKTGTATVKQVLEKYPGKVKLVFRDFPIPNLHPAAPKAHQAARCAAEQGKFWEYHDLLFENSPRQGPEDLKQYAKDLRLDPSPFAQCLESGKHEADVNRDVEEGSRLGVTATPTFFINGRQLVGAQPLTAFQKLIDSELASKASR
jgi:protein-disulfide isomerase